MNLLNRIAYSNGDPRRTITALRLINEYLARELEQPVAPAKAAGLSAHLCQTKRNSIQNVKGLGLCN